MGLWADLALLVTVVSLVPAVAIGALKGRRSLVVAGMTGIFPLLYLAAVQLAAPGSWWASRFYDPAKLERAREAHERREQRWRE